VITQLQLINIIIIWVCVCAWHDGWLDDCMDSCVNLLGGCVNWWLCKWLPSRIDSLLDNWMDSSVDWWIELWFLSSALMNVWTDICANWLFIDCVDRWVVGQVTALLIHWWLGVWIDDWLYNWMDTWTSDMKRGTQASKCRLDRYIDSYVCRL
jgi:membrane protein YqaA with SNARE-associated domain